MTTNDDAVPTTWKELLRRDHDLLEEGLAEIRDVPGRVANARKPWLPSGMFGGPSLTLAQATVVLGPEACRDGFGTLLPLVPTVMRDFADGITNQNRVPAQQLLGFFHTARCSGQRLDAAVERAEREWPAKLVEHVRFMGERERASLGLAAIVAERFDLVREFVGGGTLPKKIEAGETFGFDVPSFVRYLAAAAATSASHAAIAPAWEEFLDRFPHKLAAGTLDWPDLIVAARVVATRIDGRPVDHVVKGLRESVGA